MILIPVGLFMMWAAWQCILRLSPDLLDAWFGTVLCFVYACGAAAAAIGALSMLRWAVCWMREVAP
jgi:hypothetical protein